MTTARSLLSATSNAIGNRGVFAGGGSSSNIIDYITITSTGSATNFGDLNGVRAYGSACSDSHGGLG